MPTILLVDDEPSVLYTMEKGLRAENLKILSVETAKAGIQAVLGGNLPESWLA